MHYFTCRNISLTALTSMVTLLSVSSCSKQSDDEATFSTDDQLIVVDDSFVAPSDDKIGVLYAVHGGMDTFSEQAVWDNGIQMFAYDPNSMVHKLVIWSPPMWQRVLQKDTVAKSVAKYSFEYEKTGGTDPFTDITSAQREALSQLLQKGAGKKNQQTFVELVGWLAVGDDIGTYPHPRSVYEPQREGGEPCTYCGEDEPGGPWPGCDPSRYDVDGPVERLLKKGAGRIYLVDMTVGGARFSKTFDIYQTSMRVIEQWNAKHETGITLEWLNDPTDLMVRSYPTEPQGWTASLGIPTTDLIFPYEGSPNPIVEDERLAKLHRESIEAAFSDDVPAARTGVLLLNHALMDNSEAFDPKINDTVVLGRAIKEALLGAHPEMDPGSIVGGYMGMRVKDPETGRLEYTRQERGENLGHAFLYESDKKLPGGEWGYRYWDALALLKDRGAEHIVIGFTQIVTDSVLNLIEIPNQVAKEIGYKTYVPARNENAYFVTGGHPFADYWGVWASTDCGGQPCCFEMGGCSDGRPYPAPAQPKPNGSLGLEDPSLVFDVSAYGHLGYDPASGAPNPEAPVQGQYAGTWSMYRPPNASYELMEILADAVLERL